MSNQFEDKVRLDAESGDSPSRHAVKATKFHDSIEARPRRRATRVEIALAAVILFLLAKLYTPTAPAVEEESEYFTCHAPLPSLLTSHTIDHAVFKDDIKWTESMLKEVLAGSDGHGTAPDSISISVFLPTGQPIYEAGFGKRRANESGDSAVDGDSIYQIASITKVFTAAQIMLQKQQGLLDLDVDVSTILDDFEPTHEGWKFSGQEKVITPRQLLSHLSGLPRDITFNKSRPFPPKRSTEPRSMPTRANITQTIRDTPAVLSPYMTPVYSNIGFDIAGYLSEKLANKPYATLIAENFFQPLGMNLSSFRLSPSAIPHVVVPAAPYSNWADRDLGDAAPAGGIRSSASDLRRFGQALLNPPLNSPNPAQNPPPNPPPNASPNPPPNPPALPLTRPTLRSWLRPAHIFPDNILSIGLPWEILTVPQGPRPMALYTKGGGLPGFTTLFGVDPEREFGFALLTSGEAVNTTAIGVRIARRFAGRVEGVSGVVLEREYAGTYEDGEGEGSVAEVGVRDGGIWLTRAVIRGFDLCEAWGGAGAGVPLWPTDERGVFRLAMGSKPMQPYWGCMAQFASMDPAYANGFPVDLVVLDGETMVYGAANVTLRRA